MRAGVSRVFHTSKNSGPCSPPMRCDARRRRVLLDDGAALRVVAGDDAAERCAQLFVAHIGCT